ncbi:MAG TPA: sulfatase-like hydrolase/transferase [Sandaracinaceae bacterium LLY-WYZ-13_1]|nr:sulfatase-like hydrolase/transferase [Sandaracinaceae bacterium LLY-WYZ-13_1]
MSRAVHIGGALGAAAGLALALEDLAGAWDALPDALERARMLAALVGLEVPVGALLGALVVGLGRAVTRPWDRRVRDDARRRRGWPIPLVLLASPGLGALAWLLFTGGRASRLPLRAAWVAGAFVALAVGLYAALRAGRFLLARAIEARFAAVAATGLLALHLALGAADRFVLPGHYDYLHGALVLARWTTFGLALAVALRRRADRTPRRSRPRSAAMAAAALVGLFALDAAVLAPRQRVRVAMLSPRSPAARSLMIALGPTLALARDTASDDALARARRERARRARARPVEGPSLPDAHLVLITIDALRADHLGAYGYRARPTSPALDRLAEDAVVFERAYAQVSHSSYSLTSLMTSRYLYQRSDLGPLRPAETLADVLGGIGYHTAAFYTEGIFHTDAERLAHYRDTQLGFLRAAHHPGHAESTTDAVLEEMDAIRDAGEPPSFLWVHYFDVHEPYRDTRFGRSDEARYDSEIRRVDAAVDRLLREGSGRLSRPLVVAITADHGEEFREHGGVYHGSTVYDEQVRVPLILRLPAPLAAGGRRVAHPVELVDLAPTLLGLLDVAPAATMRGDDLRALLDGDPSDAAHVGPAFTSAGTEHAIVDWPYKLVADRRYGSRELFDLEADPGERDNRADDEPARVEALEAAIRVWLDALAEDGAGEVEVALRRGRLGDRRAVGPLAALLADDAAPPDARAEAARLLGRLPGRRSRQALGRALRAPGAIGDEAAVGLARQHDDRGRARLASLLDAPDRRRRAALALARLEDRRAAPILLEALDEPRSHRERRRVIHALGTLRDARAVEPLLALLDEPRFRRRAALALGRIGDRRAIGALRERLTASSRDGVGASSLRDATARALGQLGDRASIPRLIALAARGGTPSASESLVRLDAVGAAVGGADVGPALAAASEGLGRCEARPRDRAWHYLGRTTCRSTAARVSVPFAPPDRIGRAQLVVRARRIDAGRPVVVRVALDGRTVGSITLDGEWSERRLPVPDASAREATLTTQDRSARLELDHLLLLPVERFAG